MYKYLQKKEIILFYNQIIISRKGLKQLKKKGRYNKESNHPRLLRKSICYQLR